MSTDLARVNDHPAAVLERQANVTQMVAHTAAEALREYEQEKKVTFAALDNDTLAIVRQAYENVQMLPSGLTAYMASQRELNQAIGDLLGLED